VTRLALIADVHGNLSALEAVLANIRRRGVELVFDLGDVAHGSLQPAETVARVRKAGIDSVRGNTDRLLLAAEPPAGSEADYALARGSMSAADLDWLARQPPCRRFEDVLLCHGTPSSDTTGLLETVRPEGVSLATDAEIVSRLGDTEGATLIAAAHTHVPRAALLGDGRLCVNPGSVGLPAYEADDPCPHAMESGSPHARYAILERDGAGWCVELVAVRYDWAAAAGVALARGRADRAYWLRTGRVRGRGAAV
jgi:predicted phosphodiesterase